MAKAKSVEVTNIEEVGTEVLAQSIVDISDAAQRLEKSGLNRRALVVLIKAQTNIDYTTIGRVLDTLGQLKNLYVKR